MSYAIKIAEQGLLAACKADRALMKGVNVHAGAVTYEGVAQAHKLEYVPAAKLLA